MREKYKRIFKEDGDTWKEFVARCSVLNDCRNYPDSIATISNSVVTSHITRIKALYCSSSSVLFSVDTANWVKVHKSEFLSCRRDAQALVIYVTCKNNEFVLDMNS
jgi:hypothetical protein